jgi:hypothetical protein
VEALRPALPAFERGEVTLHSPLDVWYAAVVESPHGGISVGALGACRCVKVVSHKHDWLLEQLAGGSESAVATGIGDAPTGEPAEWWAGADELGEQN